MVLIFTPNEARLISHHERFALKVGAVHFGPADIKKPFKTAIVL